MTIQVSFEFVRGDDKVLIIELAGVDMVGAKARYVAWREGQLANELDKTIVNGGIEWDADNEELRILFPASSTDPLTPGVKYLHELEIRDVSDHPSTIFSGLCDKGASSFSVCEDRIRTQP